MLLLAPFRCWGRFCGLALESDLGELRMLIKNGEIHPLDEGFAYILEEGDFDENAIEKMNNRFFKKYAEYLLKTDYENTLDLLTWALQKLYLGEDVQFIHRPPMYCDPLQTKSTYAMKFKRKPDDYL